MRMVPLKTLRHLVILQEDTVRRRGILDIRELPLVTRLLYFRNLIWVRGRA